MTASPEFPKLPSATVATDLAVVEAEVFHLTDDAVRAANAIADQPQFNHGCADMLVRNVAGMFNGQGNLDADTYEHLPAADQTALRNLAHASYDFMFPDDGGRREIAEYISSKRPQSASQATVDILSHAFNGVQIVASIGPNVAGGYPEEKEGRLRELVRDYGRVFAGTYRALSGMNHPLAADPKQRLYFASNIRSAMPHAQTQKEDPGTPRELSAASDLSEWL